jgi:hypothetical protein
MAYEAEGPDIGFETPDHDGAVGGATDHLLEVGVETAGKNALLVALEGSFERWVAQGSGTRRFVYDLIFCAVCAD